MDASGMEKLYGTRLALARRWMLPADPTIDTPRPIARPFAATLAQARAVGLALVVAVAFVPRLAGLGASGFSEDEINKLHAVNAYDRLDFSANAEHPTVMKLLDWGAVSSVRWWDAHVSSTGIPDEAALRLPNAIVGTATTAVIFLLAETLFDTMVGGWAALFWALDPNATSINRIGKEDTLLVFFLLLAAYCYERAKTFGYADPVRREKWYGGSAAAFGLMLASKYMPHYFGLHALFNFAADRNPEDKTPDKRASFFVVMAVVFAAANFAVFLPATWHYLASYAHGDLVLHSGYDFAHRIYVNTIDASPWGLPPTFYFVFLFTKVPLAVLAAAVGGIVWTARHPDHRGATFIRVFLLFTLLPYSLVASKFVRYLLPVLAVVDIAAAVGIAWLIRTLIDDDYSIARDLAVAAIIVIAIATPLSEQLAAAPYYGLSQNAVGAWLGPPGARFPDDELYDAGVREAVDAIASAAAPGAVVCSDATTVVAEYLARRGRGDVRSCSISHDGLPMKRVDTWVVAQPGHVYFENAGVIDGLRRASAPWLTVDVGGATAVEVFHVR
jgi:hypothetical protein